MQGTPPGLSSSPAPHSFVSLHPVELLDLTSTGADPAAQAAHITPVYKLAACPPVQQADVLLAAHLRHPPLEQNAACDGEADHQQHAGWFSPGNITGRCGLVLIPAVSCLLAARSPFFRALFSGRWRFALEAQDAEDNERLDAAGPGSSASERADVAEICLPVVKLAADAGAVLQLLHWMGTGRMELSPHKPSTHSAVTPACCRCYQLRTSVMAASLAGEWLMDTAQDAAESVVVDTAMAEDCCRRSVVETAYAVHMEGLAHRLTKRFWAEAEPNRS